MARSSRPVVPPALPPTPVPLALVAPELVLPPVVAAFADLPDPRIDRTKRHRLLDIVAITLCAVMAGAEGWSDVEAFGRAREPWFRTFLTLPHGIPSHDTFGRVFARFDPAAVEVRLQAWVATVATLAAGEVVALDGKTARGSGVGAAREGALHVVSAWATEAALTLGQVRTAAKGNEITALPELLGLLDVRGTVVTVDAVGCQTAVAAQIRAQGADYLLAVKRNQPWLHDRVVAAFADAERHAWRRGTQPVPHTVHTTVEKDPGGWRRAGSRRCRFRRSWSTESRRPTWRAWCGSRPPGSACSRMAGSRPGGRRPGTTSRASRPMRRGAAVRRHWSIENRCHWSLDVTFHEDACRVRKDHAPENLALVRKVALALLRQDRTYARGLTAKRLRAGWDHAYLQTVLRGARPD